MTPSKYLTDFQTVIRYFIQYFVVSADIKQKIVYLIYFKLEACCPPSLCVCAAGKKTRDGQRNPMEELAKLTGIKEAKELKVALLMLVDGAFTERL